MSRIGLFPASGGLGTSIANHLLKLVPASQLTFISRHPEKQVEASRAGAIVRRTDYDEPESLENAFDGIDTLMLVSYPSIEIDYRIEAHKRAIEAARRSGVSHIFYSSLALGGDLETTSAARVMGAHLGTSKHLADEAARSGTALTYTAIREGLYSESFPVYTAWFDLHNAVAEIAIPHSGTGFGTGVAWAKRDELGEATAKMVVDYNCRSDREGFEYLNKVVLLSGPREVSLQETVDTLQRIVGKSVTIKQMSVDEYVALPQMQGRYMYHGVDLARESATAFEAFARGEAAVVTPVLAELLGRELEDFETTVKDCAESRGMDRLQLAWS